MFEIFTEMYHRLAREAHRGQLQNSQIARLFRAAASLTPKIWDYIALGLGNWLIKIGSALKSHSVLSQLTKKHV